MQFSVPELSQEGKKQHQTESMEQSAIPAATQGDDVPSSSNTGMRDAAGFAIPSLPSIRVSQQTQQPTGGIPQDVRTILEMMGMNGSSMPAGALETSAEEPDTTIEGDAISLQVTAERDSDEEPESSEDEPSAESDAEPNVDVEVKTAPASSSSSAPMTAARHAELLAQLTSFVKGPGEDVDAEGIGYITEDSDDEEIPEDEEGQVDFVMDGQAVDLKALRELMNAKKQEEDNPAINPTQGKQDASSSSSSSSDSESDSDSSDSEEESSALPARLAQVEMSDYEEEEETPSGPLKTEHEILEEPVQVPPFERLGEGARVILAGQVVSFIRDPGLGVWEQWQETQKAAASAAAVEEAGAFKEEETGGVKEQAEDGGEAEINVEEAENVAVTPEGGQEPTTEAGKAEADVSAPLSMNESAAPIDQETTGSSSNAAVKLEPTLEQKPDIFTIAETSTASSVPATATKRARNRGGKRRNNDGGNGTNNKSGKPNGPPLPKSSGTVVVQALRPPAGTVKGGTDRLDEDGWLLDGSVICTGDGEAVAVVAEVFGPTAQPFYLLKLPPPPFSVPSAAQLERGTRLYYPADGDHAYVPVRMLKTDKRFKGTDASNLYDEELAEHEMEWSDDEEEQAAKRKIKAERRGKKATSDNTFSARRQPHFDTASTAGQDSDDEMSIHYGGHDGGGGGGGSVRDDRSDAGFSVASSSARSRRVAQSYGDLYDAQASVGYRTTTATLESSARGGGSRGRGSARGAAAARGGRVADRFGDAPPTLLPSQQPASRNQDGGRQIGRGAGRGRGGERGGRGRGGGQQQQQQQQQGRGGTGRRQDHPQSRQQQLPPPSANLPARPRDLSPTSAHIARVTSEVGGPSNTQQQHQQQQYNGMMAMSPFGWAPQAGMGPQGMGMPMPMGMAGGMPMGMPWGMGNMGMGMMGGGGGMFPSPFFMPQSPSAGQGGQQQQQQHHHQGQTYPTATAQGIQAGAGAGAAAPGMPAINPRFMQQYQQMMAQYQGQGQSGPQQEGGAGGV